MKQSMLKRRLRLILFPLYIVALFWYLRTYVLETGQAALFLAGAMVLGVALGLVGLCFRLKSAFIASFAPGRVRAGRPDEFPLLDGDALETLTRAWQELGFEPRHDYAVNTDNPRSGTAFSRHLEHPSQGAVAEITQQFLLTEAFPMASTVISFWGDREATLRAAGQTQRETTAPPLASPVADAPRLPAPAIEVGQEIWVLMTHNRAPHKFWPLMLRGRTMARRLAQGTAPAALWSAHLEQRAQVSARLNQTHGCGELATLLEAHMQVWGAQLRARLQRTPAWKFGVAHLSLAQVPASYDGELPI